MNRKSPSLLAAVGALAVALSCAPAIPKYEINYTEYRSRMDNGLRYVVLPDANANLVEVDIRYNVGSNQDPPGKAGLAHFVEHMMFQHRIFGPDKPPLFDVIPQLTVGFNAFTNWDTTHYFLTGRKEDLETLIRLEAARMASPCHEIPKAEFEREREVVRNELRTGWTPASMIPQLVLSAVYPQGHPYEQLIIGDDDQLSNITFEDVCKFMDEYYVPQNATVIIAGDVEPDKVAQQIDFAFGAIEKGKGQTPHFDPTPKPELAHKKVVHELDVPNDSIHVAWALPPQYSEQGQYINPLLFSMTGNLAGFSSDWEFASAVYPQILGGAKAPVLVVSAELKKGVRPEEALEYVWKAAGLAHRPFEDGVFKDNKVLQKANFISQIEPLTSRTIFLGELIQFRDDFDWESKSDYLINEMNRVDQLDGGKLREFVKKTLRKDKAVVVVIKAKAGGKNFDRSDLQFSTQSHEQRKEPLVDPAEAHRPLPAPSEQSVLVEAKRFQLDNGMRVVLLPYETLPLVSMRVTFDIGGAHEPDGLEGIANIAASGLNHPAGSTIGRIGANWWGGADDDTSTIGVSGINIYLEPMLEGLERKIAIGDYSQEAIEEWRKSSKESMKIPSNRQSRAYQREVGIAAFGPEHPYATKGTWTKASVDKIGRDEAYDFKEKHYSAKNATLILTGSFDAAEAERHIRDIFGGWDGGRDDQPVAQPAQPSTARAIGVVGDSLPQIRASIVYPGPTGMDDMEAARMVLGEMLRLKMWEIRTELGSTYGVQAFRQARVGPSIYFITSGIDVTRAGETLAAMRAKVEELRQGVDLDALFAQARRNVLKRLLSQSTETGALAGRLETIAVFDRPADHYEKMVKYVAALSPAQVKGLIAQELVPDREVIALLGDRETIEKTFLEAGIDTVKYVDVTDE